MPGAVTLGTVTPLAGMCADGTQAGVQARAHLPVGNVHGESPAGWEAAGRPLGCEGLGAALQGCPVGLRGSRVTGCYSWHACNKLAPSN